MKGGILCYCKHPPGVTQERGGGESTEYTRGVGGGLGKRAKYWDNKHLSPPDPVMKNASEINKQVHTSIMSNEREKLLEYEVLNKRRRRKRSWRTGAGDIVNPTRDGPAANKNALNDGTHNTPWETRENHAPPPRRGNSRQGGGEHYSTQNRTIPLGVNHVFCRLFWGWGFSRYIVVPLPSSLCQHIDTFTWKQNTGDERVEKILHHPLHVLARFPFTVTLLHPIPERSLLCGDSRPTGLAPLNTRVGKTLIN